MPLWSREVASTLYGILKNRRENTREFYGYLAEAEEMQWWPLERLEEWQNERLRAIVQHAATKVPYYRRLFAEHGISAGQIQTKADLHVVPTLSKATIRRDWRSLVAEGYDVRKLRSESTSGTTGTPLTVWMNNEAYLRAKAAQWLQHRWAGYTHKQWLGVLAGYRVIPVRRGKPPYWTVNYAGKQVHFSTYHLSGESFPAYVQKLKESRIKYLLGYPSAIGILAQHMASVGEAVPLRGVFLSSEPTYAWQAEAIRQVFNCPIYNYFGQAERVLTATGCAQSDLLHLNMEVGVAEYDMDPKYDGGTLLIATSLWNYAMPLIRYALNDVTSIRVNTCPCGRKHESIGPVETVLDNIVITPEGGIIPPSLLYFPLQKAHGVSSAQIVQESLSRIVVRVVPDESFSAMDELSLKKGVGSVLNSKMAVEIETVQEIPRTLNGKFRFVVSNVARSAVDFGAVGHGGAT